MSLKKFFHLPLLFVLISLSALVFTIQEAQFNSPPSWNATSYQFTPSWNATSYQFTPSFFKLMTMGYWPAAVEGMWIRTLQIVSSGNYEASLAEPTAQFYDLALDLDPHFYEMYEQSAVMFTVLFHRPELAAHFLERGIRHYETASPPEKFWTHPYTLYIMLAYVTSFELHDWGKAKAIYLKAAQVPHAPPYLLEMQTWLQKENSETALARKVLHLLIRNILTMYSNLRIV